MTPDQLIAFDTETHLITDTCLAPRLVCSSIAQLQNGEIVGNILTRDETFDTFEAILSDPGNIVVGANIAYDLGVLATERPEFLPLIFLALDEGKVFDILIAQSLDAIAGGHLGKMPDGSHMYNSKGKRTDYYSLDLCCRLVLGKSDAKSNADFVLMYGQLESLPMEEWPEKAIQYPIDDAKNTLEVALTQMGLDTVPWPSPNHRPVHRNLNDMGPQTRAHFAEHLAAMEGICIDREAVSKLAQYVKDAKGDGEARFIAEGFLRPPKIVRHKAKETEEAWEERKVTKDTKAVKRRYLQSINAEPDDSELGFVIPQGIELTDGGDVSIARQVLEESHDDVLQAFAEWSALDKLESTYLPAMVDRYIILPRPNVLLDTGRSSYSGILQTIPQKGGVRECFWGGEGCKLLSHDYSQLELCTFAQVCIWILGSSKMADAINAGQNLHTLFAASLLDTDYDSLAIRVKAKEEEAVAQREIAKRCNFGFLGGMGAFKFVKTVHKAKARICASFGYERCEVVGTERGPICAQCWELAKGLREKWLEFYPEAPEYFDRIAKIVDTSGEIPQLVPASVDAPEGVARIRGGVIFTSACNTLFQGLAAQGAKHALWELTKACYLMRESELVGTAPLVFIHDEILSKTPSDRAEEASARVETIMTSAMQLYVPDVRAGVKVNGRIMERWTK